MDSVFILTKLGGFFAKFMSLSISDRPMANIFGADVAHLPGRERDQGSVKKDHKYGSQKIISRIGPFSIKQNFFI